MLAKVNGLFRLTRDCELKYTNDSKAIAKLGLACSEKYGDKETTLFIDATAFSKTAEILNQYAGYKGCQIFLTGKLQTESWQSQDGSNRSKVSMIIDGFDFVSNKDSSHTQQNQQMQNNRQYQQNVQQGNDMMNNRNGVDSCNIPEIDINTDEIPFNRGY